MKTALFASLAWVCAGLVAAAELPAAAPAEVGLLPDRLDALTARLRSDVDRKLLPGAVVLVARQGKVAYHEAFGAQDPTGGQPMARDSIFRIYSMTKPVTAVAALMLVDDGRLKLDDPVGRYLPAYTALTVGTDSPTGYRVVDATRPMTVRDLMRHTAGLDYGFVPPRAPRTRLMREALQTGPRDPGITHFAATLAKVPLAAEPGTIWNYSSGLDVLGAVVEAASGQPFGQFLRDRLFQPLDLRDTAFYVTHPAQQARLAQPFADERQVVTGSPMFDPRTPRRAEMGGEGLVSTTRDYARFLQMLLAGGEFEGKRYLRAETLAEMTRDQMAGIATGSRWLPGPGHGFGLSVAVRTAGRDAQPAGEPGDWWWGGAAGTYFWVDPKNQLITILMMQSPRQRAAYRPLLRSLVYDAVQR